ncbi:hypothetical protein BH09PAT2_BH09PAT2_06440 [soil metagenome]
MAGSHIKTLLDGRRIIVAINSQPYTHNKTHRGIQIKRGSGGAQHLMDYVMKKIGGTMVALSSGNADREVVDTENKIGVPMENPLYTLKRIFISKEEYDRYYNGFANQTMWPLCHLAFVKPLFEKRWWQSYKRINEVFAKNIIEEIKDDNTFVWVNDFQLCLLPKLIKDYNPKIKVGMFWHIPWPIRQIFSICPWTKEILEGMLAADYIGFHRESYAENFIDIVTSELNISIMPHDDTVYHKNHNTKIGSLPAGIDYGEIRKYVETLESSEDEVKKDLDIDFEQLIIGVDRIDYTKGLIERLTILDAFFEKYPEFKGRLVHLMIGSPSREQVPIYKDLTAEVIKAIDRINWKYSEGSWQPICFLHNSVDPFKVYQYYNAADVCFVSSLDDGMNLVAKEYPICAKDHKGALLLSKYTGAAQELTTAIHINPFNVSESVEKLHQALTISSSEKTQRNEQMKKTLQNNDIDTWAKKFIENTLEEPY